MGFFKKKGTQEEQSMPQTDFAAADASAHGAPGERRDAYIQLEDMYRQQKDAVVLKLYIGNFRRLNELFGYDYCEKLLDQILGSLKDAAGCPVYRYVGVEFVVILENMTMGKASRLAEQIIERFEHAWTVDGTDCLCSVQIGLCSCPGYPSDASQMLKCLDMAMFKASELGANQYAVYDSALHNQHQRRQAITRYLQTALEKDEIEVRYRPTYNTTLKKFTRAEFYMRIFVQGVGMVGAGEFLPIAEDSGQIRAVEYYALNKVAALIARLIKEGKNFDSIALPISPVLLLQEDFLDEVERVIRHYEIPAGKLGIEIDESAMSMAYVRITELMETLSQMGVELILNHFGSGYSGLGQIFELPVNTLKFERMFTWQLETNPKAEAIIEGLVQITKNVGLNLIAEGVETSKQLEALGRFGCELQQGFYYSPTLPEDVLIQVLDTSQEESLVILANEKEKMKQ